MHLLAFYFMVSFKKIREIAPFFAIAVLLSLSLVLVVRNRNLNRSNQTLFNSIKENQAKADELLGKSQKEKSSLQEELRSLKQEYETFKLEFQKVDTQWKAAVEEKTYLEEMLINKNKAIAILKKNSPQPDAGTVSAAESENLSEQIRQKDEEIRKLDEQNKILTEKLERLYKTTQSKMGEINVAKISLEETIAAARAKIDEEWNTVNLGSISMNKNVSTVREAAPKKQPRKNVKMVGRVLALNEDQGFVIVDLGKIDNLSNETALEIKMDNKVVATLSVLEIRDEMSACNIQNIKDGMKIRVNDPVFIR